MSKYNTDELLETMLKSGFFSEYLPEGFTSDTFSKLKDKGIKSTNTQPYVYTMNKNEHSKERRIISIPEVGSYVNLIKYLESEKLLKYLLDYSNNSESLSKILTEKAKFRTFNNPYKERKLEKIQNPNDDFISNIKLKLEKSIGSIGVLKLDIANLYGSFYTHNIACIGNGYAWAQEQFEMPKKRQDSLYNKLYKLDKKIMKLNQDRTHGLLTGPLISFVISEALLTRIDSELMIALEKRFNRKINFIRFMDDYDVFIQEVDDVSKIISVFTNVLQNYGFVINDKKTDYIEFPYYKYQDFESFFANTDEKKDVLHKVYSQLALINSTKDQKGSLYFLASNIKELTLDENYKQAISILIGIIKTNAKSIQVASKVLIKLFNEYRNDLTDEDLFNPLFSFLEECLVNGYDWESIWIIQVLIQINYIEFMKRIDKIDDKLNDLTKVLLINELQVYQDYIKRKVGDLNKSTWLLQYELYRHNIIINLEQLGISPELKYNFDVMKKNGIEFYKMILRLELPFPEVLSE